MDTVVSAREDDEIASAFSGGASTSSRRIAEAIRVLSVRTGGNERTGWLAAVSRLVADMRPDIADALVAYLGTPPRDTSNPLVGLTIGEIGIVYEALLAIGDHSSRRSRGQYFTPDDVARFMAHQARRFPAGHWIDPCCGVGNLAWHLASSMDDSATFVMESLTLVDLDGTALKTAVALISASFAPHASTETLARLAQRSRTQDYLTESQPPHDFAILNPPYAGTSRDERFRTADARDLYAYFLERAITSSTGFISITPAAHLTGIKYSELRALLSEKSGGEVLVFDNVPDTVFRGYKYGSTNTSKTNFVRAAITVSAPGDRDWRITPILRWASASRSRLWQSARKDLLPLRIGPAGEWAKLMRGTEGVWEHLATAERTLADIVSRTPTPFRLSVAATPRYYVSASRRDLDRTSKHSLYFRNQQDEELAYLLLNSSLPYWWWRTLEGGITLSLRNLRSLPIPPDLVPNEELVSRLDASDTVDMVTKLNAGRLNENVRRPRDLVTEIDHHVLPNLKFDFSRTFASDMFTGEFDLDEFGSH
ncbi:N-6 DNA methylase [Microbacterium sp. zg.Y909]|uniref:N-6 DNA methylase n=1 Tax=Microbacterium sp. zg.Y909 TaxID=2969413 RepID=UPI00214CB606|nr:N-6 DNA methylase [Microbacterium sp. zg.Y909]MCR2824409.1 N-6 DNA methylase [Microbacterium sp. zg.Y909]MCR2825680.1 N-6 DNA methylase [Microbacterium sp. zg.Y909]